LRICIPRWFAVYERQPYRRAAFLRRLRRALTRYLPDTYWTRAAAHWVPDAVCRTFALVYAQFTRFPLFGSLPAAFAFDAFPRV